MQLVCHYSGLSLLEQYQAYLLRASSIRAKLMTMYGAVDIGGTKTLVAVFDAAGAVVEQAKFPTPASYDEFLIVARDTVANLTTNDFRAVGVAAPGKIDHEEGILVAAGNLNWVNTPIQADFEAIFGAPVRVENDAKLAGLAEAKAVGSDFSKVVYITISTGINIGVCVDGKIDKTLDEAEAGRMSIEHNGVMTIWEQFASGKAIVATYGKRASELEDPVAWGQIGRNIAEGLITILAIIQPDIVVFGGGVGNYLEKFKEPLLAELKKYENPLVGIPPIEKAKHPEEAVIYGCYEFAKDSYAPLG